MLSITIPFAFNRFLEVERQFSEHLVVTHSKIFVSSLLKFKTSSEVLETLRSSRDGIVKKEKSLEQDQDAIHGKIGRLENTICGMTESRVNESRDIADCLRFCFCTEQINEMQRSKNEYSSATSDLKRYQVGMNFSFQHYAIGRSD
tara:strand:- start:451 stop:888 length:438 start_codon:yes stop_codon:yes gene_type:complete